MFKWRSFLGLIVLGAALLPAPLAVAQDEGEAEDPGDTKPEMVTPNFPDDTNLKVLADYVAQRLELNLIYDNTILSSRKITLRSSVAIPVDSLMDLFSNALQMHSLALKQTKVPDTLQVVQANTFVQAADELVGEGTAAGQGKGARVVSKVFSFEHTTAERVDQLIKPFLTTPGGATLPILEQNLLVITDYESNLERLAGLIGLADRPLKEVAFELIPVVHADAEAMATQVNTALAGKAAAQGVPTKGSRVSVVAEPGSNSLAVFAPKNQLEQVRSLVESLDTETGLKTEVYRLRIASVNRVDDVMASILGDVKAERLYRSVTDEKTNELVVTTTDTIHGQLAELVEKLDKPRAVEESPIRFYKLENANAEELLETLEGIRGGGDSEREDGFSGLDDSFDAGPRLPDPSASPVPTVSDAELALGGEVPEGSASSSLPDARIIADGPTNTLIVIASPAVQPIYETLIKQLDKRRPQVLVQATIVALDTTDDFELGVEFSKSDSLRDNSGRTLNFTQFGLTDVDESTGELTLLPGVGFTGAVLSADLAEVVINALKTDSRSAVLSRPQVLVNDNETGTLTSEDEEPVESQVLTGTGSAQTSFAGFATAGTTIEITPSISESDFLKLEYDITLSTFSETRVSDTLPPAKQSNQLTSVATIPDGSTIVVGGLTREVDSESISSIPLLGKIPVLKYLFSKTSNAKRRVTLFIFLRPLILRDDKFEDLKVLSGTAAGRANLPSDEPTAEPVEIR